MRNTLLAINADLIRKEESGEFGEFPTDADTAFQYREEVKSVGEIFED